LQLKLGANVKTTTKKFLPLSQEIAKKLRVDFKRNLGPFILTFVFLIGSTLGRPSHSRHN